jgi:peptidoglycan/LPS O-acetylase OafA/YrhL
MSKRLGKIVQLDALRAFAVFAVVLHHFIPAYKLGTFDIGRTGVDLFFVISGFLITAILIDQKENISNKFLILKNFIIKRILRLFPAYYLFISILLILSITGGMYIWDKGDGIFYYTYTQNILFFRKGLQAIQTNHLWTLAVEEQFYLIWPWFAVFIANKKLILGLLIVIPAAIVVKSFSGVENIRFLTFSHFDTLGSGALIALLQKEKNDRILMNVNKYRMPLISISLVALILAFMFQFPFMGVISILILSVSLVVGCNFGFQGIAGKILSAPLLIYLGQISYGLYLYHKPIPFFMNLAMIKTNMHVNGSILFVVSILLTVLISHLSYVMMEKRLLEFKVRYDL